MPIIKPVIAENVSKFKTFNLPNEFSVSYPARWFIQHTTNPPNTTPRELVIITNLKPSKIGSGELPPNLIKTDIQINPESLETSIQKVIQSRNDNQDEKITKFGKIFIGGKEAFRAWISGIEGKSILTLVRHGNKETVSIISFYSEQNPAAIPIIQRLHNSFRSYR
ncbi:MAG: hypothetical protein KME21_02565 [Desmonostoc vinosum HA7617-LM4]|nr:hypothetical protein [Desmonostoc vinosum HA7617-LM4]